MATGAPGTNGVWQYGEDDSETTFSGLLNKVASTTNTQIGADRTRLTSLEGRATSLEGRATSLEARPLAGLVPISPTSVVIGSGSGSANTLGQVSFTSATSVLLNNVFTSTYKNYKITININTSSSSTILLRMSSSGVASNSGYWTNGLRAGAGANLNNWNYGASATEFALAITDSGYNSGHAAGTIEMLNPAEVTSTTGTSSMYSANGGFVLYQAGFEHGGARDGFVIIINSGTMTGSVQVFGYND